MADFNTHWRVGLVTSTLGAMISNWWGLAAPKLLPLLVLVGWIGSIIPDIDSDTSKPRRFIFRGLSIIVPPVLIYRLAWVHQSSEHVVIFWIGCALLILYPLKYFFKRYTRHRGAYHSIPAALVYGCLCAALAHHEDASRGVQTAISFVAVIGFITHLTLDELWAVDFNGTVLRTKRSFGTALSLRARQSKVNLILYTTLALSLRLWWAQWHGIPFVPESLSIVMKAWSGAVFELISTR